MRFFATLICALGASISVVSAAHIRGRNAFRMAQGLPPLPPRRTTRTDTARRDVPSGVSTPLLFDGDFEADSGSPWVYTGNAKRSDDPTLCRASSHCGLMQPDSTPGSESAIKYPMTLTHDTDYVMTFYEYFQKDPADNDVRCTSFIRAGLGVEWLVGYTTTSDSYNLRSMAFTTPGSGNIDITFAMSCTSTNKGKWFIDGVTVTVDTPSGFLRK